jgi:nucleotidyltransferase/DNA polymerase involved in DNA repair
MKTKEKRALKEKGSVKGLGDLRNVGKATLSDFVVLGIETVDQLTTCDAKTLYKMLQDRTGLRHDPCCEDVFAAAIHEAKTGEALDWWVFSKQRKAALAAKP